jgi:hypothetical protein
MTRRAAVCPFFAATHCSVASTQGVDMDFLRKFHTAVLVGLGVTATACQQQSAQLLVPPANAAAQPMDAKVLPERVDAYFRDIFSEEQKALALAFKPPEAEAPTF